MMIASVTAVAANRAVQLNRRPIHHSIAQHITTGTISSGRIGSRARQCGTAPPTPMLTAPPTFTQVPVPSTFTKPGP